MDFWILFWLLIIAFSIISFSYMSVKIVYKGVAEIKEMFESLNSSK